MSAKAAVRVGPRFVTTPAGRLRAALLVSPNRHIERATPLAGEPGAIYARALEQHAILAGTLRSFGVETIDVPARGNDPMECAAADSAVVLEDGAIVMRPTAMSRRADADRMSAQLAHVEVPLAGHIEPPGLLDGNDVVLAGDTAFVGVGRRGNEAGRRCLADLARARGLRVAEVRLADGVPALRAVANAVAADTVLLAPGKADPAPFAGMRTVLLDAGEEFAAGALCLGERRVLADVRYRTALVKMRRAGIAVDAIDLYDFGKLGITPAMLVLALQRD